MKKLLTILLLIVLTGCQANKRYDLFDTQGYNYVVLELPNGEVVEGKIDYWRDFDGEQLEVKVAGVIYLVSSFNCVLMYK